MQGQVFDIQHFSTHDGPGIRTTVFFKGCPLKCAWCHNPESQQLETEILFSPTLCIDCRFCETACPQNNAREILSNDKLRKQFCDGCYLCAEACSSGAIKKTGESMSVPDVMKEVEKDRVFYENSGGGMTLSGGEPLFQAVFALELLKTAKESGIHTCVETSGFVSQSSLEKLLPFIDLFLFDIKLTDSELHKKWTGVPFERILENLKFIDSQNKKVQLRAIMIPEVNMNEDHYTKLAEICNGLKNIEMLEFMPYHNLGNSKLEKLGKLPENHFIKPEKEKMLEVKNWISKQLKKYQQIEIQ